MYFEAGEVDSGFRQRKEEITMPVVRKDFDSYSFTYVGGPSLQSGTPGADIVCYRTNCRVGILRFFRDGVRIPENRVLPDGTLALYFEMSRFSDVMATLRYEKPLYLAVNSDNSFGYIGPATLEPTGEQEAI
jgi:hypothetical protein